MKKPAKVALGPLMFVGVLAAVQPFAAQAEHYVTDPQVEAMVRGDQSYAFPAGYIRANQPFVGIVNQITGDNQMSGNRMISGGTHSVYVRLNAGQEAKLGTLYTVYRRYHKVYHPVSHHYIGELIHQLAVVKIVQIEGPLAVAKVVATNNPIGPGDHLMPFVSDPPPAVRQAGTTPSGEVEAMVIDFLANKTLVGQRQVVYLDRGRSEGLNPGDVMTVFRVGGGLPRRTFGELKVLAVEDHTATAVITKAFSPVLIGDRVSTKQAAPVQAEALPVVEPAREVAKKADEVSQPVPAPAPVHVSVQPATVSDDVVVSLNELMDHLYFESGDASVRGEGKDLLKHIGLLLKDMPDKPIRIEGHADAQEIGPSLKSKYPTNRELSKARAVAVAEVLAQEAGLDPVRLITVGHGARKPVATNATDEGRQKNRRVEIVFSGDRLKPEAVNAPSEPTVAPADVTKDAAVAPVAPAETQATASYTDQSLQRSASNDANATTLSTVATPSLSDGGSMGSDVGTPSTPAPDQPAATGTGGGAVGSEAPGGNVGAPENVPAGS